MHNEFVIIIRQNLYIYVSVSKYAWVCAVYAPLQSIFMSSISHELAKTNFDEVLAKNRNNADNKI